jgi:hypothetical protein
MMEIRDRTKATHELADDLIEIYTTGSLLQEELVLMELELDEIRATLSRIKLRKQLKLKPA